MSLISVADLAALAGVQGPRADRNDAGDDLVICDVRFHLDDHERGRRLYDEAHLPGARFVDLHHELAAVDQRSPKIGGRHPLPTVEQFARLLGSLGVSPWSFVVAYDDLGGAIASRLWWMLRSIGHERAAVLDGGVGAWVAASLPTTATEPAVTPTEYPTPDGWTGLVTADELLPAIESGVTVIDARAAARFRGDAEPLDARAGHVPGAINRFHGDNVRPDGLHLSPTELRALFDDVGERPIVYCGSGVTACHDLLALSLAGVDDARLYPGSWSEWSADPDRPLATGDE